MALWEYKRRLFVKTHDVSSTNASFSDSRKVDIIIHVTGLSAENRKGRTSASLPSYSAKFKRALVVSILHTLQLFERG
jgi:hypothetical protein